MVIARDAPGELRRRTAYADVPNRVVAYGLDVVILTVLALVAAVVVSALLGPTISFDPSATSLSGSVRIDRGLELVNAAVNTLLSGLYFVGSWLLWRGTPGQRLLRLQVRDTAGGRVGFGGAVLRWLLLGAPFGLLSVLVLGSGLASAAVWFAVVVWDVVLLVTTARGPRGQGLHDRAGGTTVVKLLPAREEPVSF